MLVGGLFFLVPDVSVADGVLCCPCAASVRHSSLIVPWAVLPASSIFGGSVSHRAVFSQSVCSFRRCILSVRVGFLVWCAFLGTSQNQSSYVSSSVRSASMACWIVNFFVCSLRRFCSLSCAPFFPRPCRCLGSLVVGFGRFLGWSASFGASFLYVACCCSFSCVVLMLALGSSGSSSWRHGLLCVSRSPSCCFSLMRLCCLVGSCSCLSLYIVS